MAQTPVPNDVLAMEQAARCVMSNVRDPEEIKRACEHMDAIREEIRKKHGVLDIGGPAVRELRDE